MQRFAIVCIIGVLAMMCLTLASPVPVEVVETLESVDVPAQSDSSADEVVRHVRGYGGFGGGFPGGYGGYGGGFPGGFGGGYPGGYGGFGGGYPGGYGGYPGGYGGYGGSSASAAASASAGGGYYGR